MRRRLHLIFAATTVLLVAVWLLSGRWRVSVEVGRHSYACASFVGGGCIYVALNEDSTGPRRDLVSIDFEDTIDWGLGYRLTWLPNGRWRMPRLFGERSTWLAIPLWIPAMVAGARTAVLWRRHRERTRRERAGVCLSCGYDLAGVPRGEDGTLRCPECGKRLRVKEWSAA